MAFVFGAGLVIFGLYQVFQSLGVYSRAQSAMHEGFAATIMLTGVVAISAGLILIALARILVEMRAVRPVVPGWEGRLFGRRKPWISVAIDEKSQSLQRPTEEARIEADVAAGNRVPVAKIEPVAADRIEGSAASAIDRSPERLYGGAVVCSKCGTGNLIGTQVCRCGAVLPQAASKTEPTVALKAPGATSSVASVPRAVAVPGEKYCPMCGFGNPPGTAVCRCGCDLKRHG